MAVEGQVGALVVSKALGGVPVGKYLCNDPIGAGTASVVSSSRNSRSAGVLGPWRSAKGKAISSKMTCQEMMTLLDNRSRQRYPL
jgi:hypothetical protein